MTAASLKASRAKPSAHDQEVQIKLGQLGEKFGNEK
jgi:hypothetical protein